MLAPGILDRVTSRCVHFTDAGEWAARKSALSNDTVVFEMHGAGLRSYEDFFTAFAEAIGYPNKLARNWNAGLDVLRDLSWVPAQKYVLVVDGARTLWRELPEDAADLLEVWQAAAESRAKLGTPFHLVFVW
jgi:hypothetical protein